MHTVSKQNENNECEDNDGMAKITMVCRIRRRDQLLISYYTVSVVIVCWRLLLNINHFRPFGIWQERVKPVCTEQLEAATIINS